MTETETSPRRPTAIPARDRLAAFARDVFIRDVRGATAIEYGLLVAGLALAIITAVTAVGTNIAATLGKVSNALH